MYQIEIVPEAISELKTVPIFYRRIIVSAIETKLPFEPTKVSKNRKCLEGLVAGFEHEPPLWELRAQEWRIFYDVDEDDGKVVIRAIRRKLPGTSTEEII